MRRSLQAGALALLMGVCPACQSQWGPNSGGPKTNGLGAGGKQAHAQLTQVDLFPNGVGFFEYQGTVDGNASQKLYFRSGQINDVLASLVFQDTGGGRVGEATFPSQEPLSVTLHGLSVNLDGNPSLAAILGQFRGDWVTLTIIKPRHKTISGRIIDLHQANLPFQPQPRPVPWQAANLMQTPTGPAWCINLFSHGHIRSIALANVAAIHLDNPRLQRSFDRALNALARQPNPHKREITLWFHGTSSRLVRFAYLLETPLWRITYRLVIPSGKVLPKAKMLSQPVLQAFAIVSNQTDMNWRHLRLHLLGGKPISFIDDLYRPLYLPRSVAPLPSGVSFRPQTYGNSWGPVLSLRGISAPGVEAQFALRSATANAVIAEQHLLKIKALQNQAGRLAPFNPLQGVQAMAHTGRTHPAFDYRVSDVSIPRQQSAMVPILVAPIQGRPLDLYVDRGYAGHPLQSMQLTNTTGKYLLAGPLSVVRQGSYGGDVQLPSLGRGQKRIISFAVDQSVNVRPMPQKNTSVLISAEIKDATLIVVRDSTHQSGYLLVNRAATARTVLVRQNQMPGWKIVTPARHPAARHGMDQFELTLPTNATAKLPIVRTQAQRQLTPLPALKRPALLQLIQTPHLPVAVVTVLKQAVALRKIVHQKQAALNATGSDENRVMAYQAHLRENLMALNKASNVYNAMAADLQRQEVHLQKLRQVSAAQRVSLSTARTNLADFWKKARVAKTLARPGK